MKRPAIDLSPSAVWQRSPLTREAIDRIIAAVKHDPGAEFPAELPRLVIATLAHWHYSISLEGREAEGSRRIAMDAYIAYAKAAAKIPWWDQDPPPSPPAAFLEEMTRWIERRPKEKGRGAPEDTFRGVVFWDLVAVIHSIFHRPATQTADGPTVRFITAYFREMNAFVMATNRTAETLLDSEAASVQAKRWEVPIAATIQGRVRDHRTRAGQNLKVLALREWYLHPRGDAEGFFDFLSLKVG